MKITDYLEKNLNYSNESSEKLEEKTSSAWRKVRKGIATGIALAMFGGASLGTLSKPAEAQQRTKASQTIVEKNKKKLDFTIYPMEMYYSDGQEPIFVVTDGKQYDVTSDAPEIYLKPQTRNGLTTEILFKLQDKDAVLNLYYMTDDKGYITDRATGQRVKVIEESFDIDDFSINPGEEVMCEVRYQDDNTIYQTMMFSVTKQIPEQSQEEAKKEAEKKYYEERAKAEINKQLDSFVIAGEEKAKKQKSQDMFSKEDATRTEQRETEKNYLRQGFSFKGAWLTGKEAHTAAADTMNLENTFDGLLLSGQYFHPNLNLWANFMSLAQDTGIVSFSGAPMGKKFSQTSVGLATRLWLFYGEVEAIYAKNDLRQYTAISAINDLGIISYRESSSLQESNYGGLFLSGGIMVPLGDSRDGFASNSFVQLVYGQGFAKQNYAIRDGTWAGLVTSSESITERDYVKVRLKSPFLEGVYSQSYGENSDKTLHQTRKGGDIILKLPLSTVLGGEIFKRLKLMGYIGMTEVNSSQIHNYKNTRYGIGIVIEN